jgi:hypothetical protein
LGGAAAAAAAGAPGHLLPGHLLTGEMGIVVEASWKASLDLADDVTTSFKLPAQQRPRQAHTHTLCHHTHCHKYTQ